MITTASIIATLTPSKGNEAKVQGILTKLVEQTAKEAGALSYDLCVAEDSPESFIVAERYADKAARDLHISSPHLAGAMQECMPLLACPPKVVLLRTLASIGKDTGR